jgi:starvation-inducible DNA-binding protein
MKSTLLYPTRSSLHADIRASSVMLLQRALVHLLDLERQAKQAHWNVRGLNFSALHALFDTVAEEATQQADLCAERLVALGGFANGSLQAVSAQSTLAPYPSEIHDGTVHLSTIADAVAGCGTLMRELIDAAAQSGDADSADVFTGISCTLDQRLWMVEAHLEP